MSHFITNLLIAPNADFDACYALMQATFPADELVDRAEYEHLLRMPPLISHPHWFAMLARWEENPTSTLVGMIAGSYMALEGYPGVGMAMIEYLAVAPEYQQDGHGGALLNAFEHLMHEYAGQRGERLHWVVGEVEDELLPFKFHQGYALPERLWYAQPPIEFDALGQPCYAPVTKHLVMKPMHPPTNEIAPDVVRAIVQTIYRWRYVPLLGDDAAKTHAAAYIEREVYTRVSVSVGDVPLVLRQTLPEG